MYNDASSVIVIEPNSMKCYMSEPVVKRESLLFHWDLSKMFSIPISTPPYIKQNAFPPMLTIVYIGLCMVSYQTNNFTPNEKTPKLHNANLPIFFCMPTHSPAHPRPIPNHLRHLLPNLFVRRPAQVELVPEQVRLRLRAHRVPHPVALDLLPRRALP